MKTEQRFAFIFDMDGTMIDNMPFHNRIWVQFLNEIGGQPDENTFHDQTAGKTNPEIIRMYLGQETSDADIERYSQEKEIRYRSLYSEHLRTIPGLAAFFEKVRQRGILLGLASSAWMENIHFVLEGLGVSDYFQVIVSGEEVKNGKPDPEIFLEAARRLEIPPAQCLVFEDASKGIEAAHHAGMDVVLVTTSMSRDQALRFPGVRMAIENYIDLDPAQLIQEFLERS